MPHVSACCVAEMLSSSLYGLILHQTYRYVRLHPHDYAYIQVLVSNPLPSQYWAGG